MKLVMMLLTIGFAQAIALKRGTTDACRPEDGYFKCESNDECYPRYRVRDGDPECSDHSDEGIGSLNCSDDEEQCRTTKRCLPRHMMNTKRSCELYSMATFPCRVDQEFECSESKLCIPRRFVNDEKVDCNTVLIQDNSDERQTLPWCLASEFSCNESETLRCIPREWVGDGFVDCKSGIDEQYVIKSCDRSSEFRCKESGRCIPRYRVLDDFADCPNGTDESEALQCLPRKEFRCNDTGRCIPRSWRGNKLVNCLDGSDEIPVSSNESCVDGEFRCNNNKRCIPKSLVCDGMDHCGDCSDEIESCSEPRMFRCPTNPSLCVHWAYSCDVYSDCLSNSDDFTSLFGFKCNKDFVAGLETHGRYCSLPQWLLQDNYANCDDESDLCYANGTFQCAFCLNNRIIIAKRQICDGVLDCPDFSDECLCAEGMTTSNRSQEFCNNLCYEGHDGVPCRHCHNGELWCPVDDVCVSAEKVCDQIVDCPLSKLDEAFCTSAANDRSSVEREVLDFTCDPIPPEIIKGAKDWNIESFVNSTLPAKSKSCNGIIECMNYEDECSERANCSDRPEICTKIPLVLYNVTACVFGNDDTFSAWIRPCGFLQFAFGTSICNGVLDCKGGEDEEICSDRRFTCNAGTVQLTTGVKDVVNIPIEKHCDGVYPPDCIDESDEANCSEETHFYCENGNPLFVPNHAVVDGKRDCSDFSDECPPNLFQTNGLSSREELIKSNALRILIWLMMTFAISGNLSIAVMTIARFARNRNKPTQSRSRLGTIYNILILNLALADFLMGIVLLIVGVKTAQFSGSYCLEDKAWRASSLCASVGVLTVLSSEASVLTLVCITSYRLYAVNKPLAARHVRLRVLSLWILLTWASAFALALLPLANFISESMITHMLITYSPYFSSDTVGLSQLRRFGYRITNLNNGNTSLPPQDWYSLESYLRMRFPNHAPTSKGYFGYYSHTGVCMPKLYRISTNDRDSHPISWVLIIFNFTLLLYIVVAYIAICRRSVGSTLINASKSQSNAAKMYLKITLLIVTDMCCWFPICVMGFLSMAQVTLDPVAHTVSAVVLLPINSSFNPIIYDTPLTALRRSLASCFKRIQQTGRSVRIRRPAPGIEA